MSAFMCKPETISRITNYLDFKIRDGHLSKNLLPKEFYPYIEMSYSKSIWPADIFNELKNMNIRSLKERYGDDIDDMLYPEDQMILQKVEWSDLFVVANNMDCFIYQCTEGDIPDTELYQFVEKQRLHLFEELVRTSNAYLKAEWG